MSSKYSIGGFYNRLGQAKPTQMITCPKKFCKIEIKTNFITFCESRRLNVEFLAFHISKGIMI